MGIISYSNSDLVWKESHRTRDGRTLQISDMDDGHLSNTIRMVLRRMVDLKTQLENLEQAPAYTGIMGLVRGPLSEDELQERRQQLVDQLREGHRVAGPYVYEALCRQLPVMQDFFKVYNLEKLCIYVEPAAPIEIV